MISYITGRRAVSCHVTHSTKLTCVFAAICIRLHAENVDNYSTMNDSFMKLVDDLITHAFRRQFGSQKKKKGYSVYKSHLKASKFM